MQKTCKFAPGFAKYGIRTMVRSLQGCVETGICSTPHWQISKKWQGELQKQDKAIPKAMCPCCGRPKKMQHAVALHKATTPWATACQGKSRPFASVKKHYKQSDALNLKMTMRCAAMCMQYMMHAATSPTTHADGKRPESSSLGELLGHPVHFFQHMIPVDLAPLGFWESRHLFGVAPLIDLMGTSNQIVLLLCLGSCCSSFFDHAP